MAGFAQFGIRWLHDAPAVAKVAGSVLDQKIDVQSNPAVKKQPCNGDLEGESAVNIRAETPVVRRRNVPFLIVGPDSVDDG